MLFPEIETPALLIEQAILNRNIETMQRLADSHHVKLRPHIKTHKSAVIAGMQLVAGACGIAVAKLSEAEIMARHGIHDIQVANQVTGASRIRRLLALADSTAITCCIDSAANAHELSAAFSVRGRRLAVFIEIDTGLHRCGLSDPDQIVKLGRVIDECEGLALVGIMTHAGHAYAAADINAVGNIGRSEGETMVRLAEVLRRSGLRIEQISVGSTPTARHAVVVPGITELRVGNYAFNDMIQVSLGVATRDQCALTVLSTVISVPADNRAVIDAGSKSLTTEQGAHGNAKLAGYGRVCDRAITLTRLSEEHGVIEPRGIDVSIGSRIRIIPNHACATVNLYDHAYLVDGDRVLQQIPIDARGCIV
ncbi:alanine racemase [candidate division GN15 bacterium]|uniref:Alanine racemase n=1 Tax=candidate division GN15 bacterium TaxID=2072418 RepID=A0A855WUC2_9BACT|nr:MAG: alanine racemase [candidate division GN15 bacterium]